jgi:hypothetical protein
MRDSGKTLKLERISDLFRQNKNVICAFFVSLSATLGLYISLRNGLRLTDDSRFYLFAAKSFSETGVFLKAAGEPFCEWPPLFPFYLSFFDDAVSAAKRSNLLFFFLSTFLISISGVTFFRERVLAFFFQTTLLFALPLAFVHYFLWSESLFIFFVLSACILFHEGERRKSIVLSFFSGIFFLAAVMQRNLGLPFFAGFVFLFFSEKLFLRAETAWQKLVFASLPVVSGFSAYKIAFPCSEQVANNLFSRGFWENFLLYARITGRFFVPPVGGIDFFFGGFLLLLVLVLPFFIFLKPLKCSVFVKSNSLFSPLSAGGVSAYAAAILIFRPATEDDAERLFAPIFPFLLFLLGSIFRYLNIEGSPANKHIRQAAVFLIALYMFLRYLKNCHWFVD